MPKTQTIPRTPNAYEPPMLIQTLLAQSVRYEPQREIVYRDLFRMTYTTFHKRVQQLANVLTSMGVTAGDVVAVLDWDSHRYLECFFGVPGIGAVLHTVNVRLAPAQIQFTMHHAHDTVVLVHDDFLPLIEAIRPHLPTVKHYIVLSDKAYGDEAVTVPEGFAGEYEALLKTASDQYEFTDFDENTRATTFYTTGTTGNPKGVYFSHRQLYLHTMGLCTYMCGYQAVPFSSREDVYMPITPMFHVHAWGFPYLATMLSTKQVYPGKYEPEMLLRLLLKEGVTLSHCVPTILTMLVNSPVAQQVDLSRWKVIIGGSALTRGLAKAALDLGIQVYQGYGMSETAPVMAVTYLNDTQRPLPIDAQLDLRTRAGRIAPFVELRLMDEQGNFLPHDGQTAGELVARAPWLTQGYYDDDQRAADLWTGGWMHTGDVATISPDYWLTIVDRTKDVIKTGGEWISSLDIENLISQLDGVAETAVVGLPHQRWGERPHALIMLKPNANLTANDISQKLQHRIDEGHLNKWYMPDSITFVSEIPKTSVGKIDKKKIRQQLGNIASDLPPAP